MTAAVWFLLGWNGPISKRSKLEFAVPITPLFVLQCGQSCQARALVWRIVKILIEFYWNRFEVCSQDLNNYCVKGR